MMNQRYQNHLFWGSHAPLSTLTALGLLVTASSRTAFALISAGALVWVYGWTVLVYCWTRRIFPKRGKNPVLALMSAFFGSLYLLLLGLISPFLAIEAAFFIILAPVSCVSCGIVGRVESLDLEEGVVRACLEGLVLGGLIFALALIREPLGHGSLSLPGGGRGIIELFNGEDWFFFPVRIIGGASSALLLLGYGLALFRHVKSRYYRENEL
jgi:Na+-translocating ferredoxin:NAD+ oxidoreductase RnfE subunit